MDEQNYHHNRHHPGNSHHHPGNDENKPELQDTSGEMLDAPTDQDTAASDTISNDDISNTTAVSYSLPQRTDSRKPPSRRKQRKPHQKSRSRNKPSNSRFSTPPPPPQHDRVSLLQAKQRLQKSPTPSPPPAAISPPETDASDFDDDQTDNDSSTSSESSSSSTRDTDQDTYEGGGTTTDEDSKVDAGDDDDEDSSIGSKKSLDNAHLTDDHASVISSATSNTTGSSHKRLMERLLQDDPSLTDLCVDALLLETTSISELSKGLAYNTTVVQLTFNLPRGLAQHHIITLLNSLESNDTIASLALWNLSIDKYLAMSLGSFFSATPTLTKIRLKDCHFVESGLAIFCCGLQHCQKTLSSWSMENIKLGAFAVDIVASCIPLLQLTSLQLKNTQLSLDGLSFLLQCLERGTSSLQFLDLSYNDIISSSEGTGLLVDALECMTTLQRLKLQHCGLNNQAIKTICQEGLWNHSSLTHLDVSHQPQLDDRAAKYLVKLVQQKPKLVQVRIENCPRISKRWKHDLSDKLRYNNSFLKNMGLSREMSLAILDSMQMLENMTKT